MDAMLPESGAIIFRNGNHAVRGGSQADFFLDQAVYFFHRQRRSREFPLSDLAGYEQSFRIVNDVDVFEPRRVRLANRPEEFHVVRPADEDRIVVAPPITEKRFEQGPAHACHEFHFRWHVGINRRPVFFDHV